MNEDPKEKEFEEHNKAGNCTFKDRKYEKAIRSCDYVILLYSSSLFKFLSYSLKYLAIIQIVLLFILELEICFGFLQLLRKRSIYV